MVAMVSGSLSNAVLDYIFIFPLGMGSFGAALATGLAPVISIVVISPYLIGKRNRFHFVKSLPAADDYGHRFQRHPALCDGNHIGDRDVSV